VGNGENKQAIKRQRYAGEALCHSGCQPAGRLPENPRRASTLGIFGGTTCCCKILRKSGQN
jgi:hypothetical protein